LHDINSLVGIECGGMSQIIRRTASGTVKGVMRTGVRFLKQMLRGRICKDEIFMGLWNLSPLYRCALTRTVSSAASLLLVITSWERNLLLSNGIVINTVLIPHFVENIPDPPAASVSNTSTSVKTIVVVGFIFNQKGHRLVVEAMPLMPNVRVIFVGGPGVGGSGAEQYSRIMDLVHENGVQDRLEVTGYLDDEEFQRRIRAADLAVCPFTEYKSASGSLSALIAAGCPILASDVPLISEYNAMVPGAIPTFAPYTADALATAVSRLLMAPRAVLTDGIARLGKHLSITTIYSLHLDAYKRTLHEQHLTEQSSNRRVRK
jgi:glycosyltransferase involved in cell wall biosynthesis